MADENRLSLKVWVDNEKKHVVFAEADSDFIDILCSFLTLPLGTIIKLLSKKTGLGSIDNLYKSIERLDYQNFSTKACKNILLSPRSDAAESCENLKLNLDDDPIPREFFFCEMDGCTSRSPAYYSLVRDSRCYYCGKFMNKVGLCEKEKKRNDGVFVKRNDTKFIITNDFRVTTCSLFHCYDVLKEFGETDTDLLEEKSVEFGKEEFLNMLKNLLIGNDALTNICFPNLNIRRTTPINNKWMEMNGLENKREEDNTEPEMTEMQIKLIMNKTNSNVVCAEIEDDFAEQLFSFLAFPLGSVLNLLGCYNPLGHMTNFYRSIQEMKYDCFESSEKKRMLVSPQLVPFFRCRKQMLYVMESPHYSHIYCYEVSDGESNSTTERKYRVQISCLTRLHQITKFDKNIGGGFVEEGQSFLVTDDLHVAPISVCSVAQILKMQGLHVDHLEKKEITVSRVQACAVLRAMLVSKTVLNDALFPYGK